MKPLLLSSIRFYKKYFSFLTYGSCRFHPTCSVYMYEALQRYGIITGLSLGVKRILRCHPWNNGGSDPVV